MAFDPLHEITALHVSDRLVREGSEDKALELLVRLATTPGQSFTVKLLKNLARMMHRRCNWTDVANLLRAVAGSSEADLETHFCLAHSLFELDDRKAAEHHLELARRCIETQGGPAQSEIPPLVKEIVYEQIAVHFLAKSVSKARDLFRVCSLVDSYIPSVLNTEVNRLDDALSDRSIEARLKNALEQWEQTNTPLACGLGNRDAMPGAHLDDLAGKKVLLVMRRYFLSSSDSREHELAFFFRTSATAVGMDASVFAAEPFLNPRSVSQEEQYAALDNLVQLILETKPDLVVFDNLGCTYEKDGYLDKKAYRAVFEHLKSIHPFRLAVFYPDSWTEESIESIEFVSAFANVVWHQNSDLGVKAASTDPKRGELFLSVIPYPDALFSAASTSKSLDAVFLGSVFAYNCPRAVWLMLIQEKRIPCAINLSNHTVSGSAAGASVEDYVSFLGKVRIMVNFSARSVSRKIMTGRAWEAILAKSLLLEEDNEEIKRFFVPFVHYVPFQNIHELEAYIDFFNRHESFRQSMAERAFTWFKRNYDQIQIWTKLLGLK